MEIFVKLDTYLKNKVFRFYYKNIFSDKVVPDIILNGNQRQLFNDVFDFKMLLFKNGRHMGEDEQNFSLKFFGLLLSKLQHNLIERLDNNLSKKFYDCYCKTCGDFRSENHLFCNYN